MKTISVGLVGYGNLGRGAREAIGRAPDMELKAVFTRRDPASLGLADVPVFRVEEAPSFQGKIDVMILCGGSATDLPEQGPKFAAMFNTVDSFDTHANIPAYRAELEAAAKDHVAILSVGWDPGLFSMMRLLGEAVLPDGDSYTFWGRGVSQGHSDAIRRVPGVADAIQYTVPVDSAIGAVRAGERPQLTAREKHLRECYVVLKEGADPAAVEAAIKTMPNYFADYDTEVNFISMEELRADHRGMPHGGFVMRGGSTGADRHNIEFALSLGSNPGFTASVLTAYARAAARMAAEGARGARTVFDVPLSYLSPRPVDELIAELL